MHRVSEVEPWFLWAKKFFFLKILTIAPDCEKIGRRNVCARIYVFCWLLLFQKNCHFLVIFGPKKFIIFCHFHFFGSVQSDHLHWPDRTEPNWTEPDTFSRFLYTHVWNTLNCFFQLLFGYLPVLSYFLLPVKC